MWKPWRKALIIRPLHYSIGYKVLCDRAKVMWKLEGEFHALDLGHGCFLFRFSKCQDYKNVLLGGPWNIGDYCVVVRRWNPWFDPSEDILEKVNAWIRVSGILVWCYNPIGFKCIGDKLGKVMKIDHSTKYVYRGKYAKFCVEVDLTKKLDSRVGVEGQEYFLSYEGLDSICFTCG